MFDTLQASLEQASQDTGRLKTLAQSLEQLQSGHEKQRSGSLPPCTPYGPARPINPVAIQVPDLDDTANRYQAGTPRVSLNVKVTHPDSRKNWSGVMPLPTIKQPHAIPTLPFLVEMEFLYHPNVAPDFAILRLRYDPASIRPARPGPAYL